MTSTRLAAPPVTSDLRWTIRRDTARAPGARTARVATPQVLAADARDAASLRQVADGDDRALADLYDRHAGLALGIATRITSDRTLAEDAVQDAFISVWRNAATFDPTRSPVRSWIAMIVRRRAIDAVRRRKPVVALDAAGVEAALPPGPDVWADVSQRLDRDAILHAMASIAPRQRDVLELAYFGGLTQVEISARTGTPLGTVKSRARLGLQSLRVEIDRALS